MERLDPQMVRVYRRMNSEERVQAGLAATDLVRDRLRAHFTDAHPQWSVQEVERAVAGRLLRSHDGG